MALRSGLDTVAIASRGIYTETYGAANTDNVADLHASRGYLENAPVGVSVLGKGLGRLGFGFQMN